MYRLPRLTFLDFSPVSKEVRSGRFLWHQGPDLTLRMVVGVWLWQERSEAKKRGEFLAPRRVGRPCLFVACCGLGFSLTRAVWWCVHSRKPRRRRRLNRMS